MAGADAFNLHELKSSVFLDLETLTWEPKANLPREIKEGTSVPYQDSFLIVGGWSVNRALNSIYYYNPSLDEWELLDQRMDFIRENFAAFTVPDSFANCS